MLLGQPRPFLSRPVLTPLAPRAPGQVETTDEWEVRDLLERSAAVAGVGPRASAMLRLALDGDGYPDGATLRALRDDMTLDEALELEAVSMRRRDEVGELSKLLRAQAERNRPKQPGGS